MDKIQSNSKSILEFSLILFIYDVSTVYLLGTYSHMYGVWLCFPYGVKLGFRRETLSVWLLIPWNLLQRYSWDHECRSPYCEKETDSSWKANEHVSAIWKSHPKHYASSVLRQRSHFTLWKDLFPFFLYRWGRKPWLHFSQLQHNCDQCNKFWLLHAHWSLHQITSHIL